jgi:hypothetical protein
MTHIHNKCDGKVEIFSSDYGLCTECGEEGELTVTDTSPPDDIGRVETYVDIDVRVVRQ